MTTKDTGGSAVADVITRDCGCGFSSHAVLDDGTRAFYTTRLHPTREEAAQEVAALASSPEAVMRRALTEIADFDCPANTPVRNSVKKSAIARAALLAARKEES